MNYFREIFCEPIYILANRIVSKCRSEKESRLLRESFAKHFKKVDEYEVKANEYERIMSKKEDLVEAVKTIKEEAVEAKSKYFEAEEELTAAEIKIQEIIEENETMKYVIAMICDFHSKEDWENLDGLIRTLSQQYLPKGEC